MSWGKLFPVGFTVASLCAGCALQPPQTTATTAPHLSVVLSDLKQQLRGLGDIRIQLPADGGDCGLGITIKPRPYQAVIAITTATTDTAKANAGGPIPGAVVITPGFTVTGSSAITHVDTLTLDLSPPSPTAGVKPPVIEFEAMADLAEPKAAAPAEAGAAPQGDQSLRDAVVSDLVEILKSDHAKPCVYLDELDVQVAFQVTGTGDANVGFNFMSVITAGVDVSKSQSATNTITLKFKFDGDTQSKGNGGSQG